MSTTSVFATATSPIHADLIVVALKRVGIPIDGVSIVYPRDSQPDSVLYWVDGTEQITLSLTGEPVIVSGPLRFALVPSEVSRTAPLFSDALRGLGLTENQSVGFEASLFQGKLVLSIEASDESELALIFHILHHIGAEKIVLTETGPLHRGGRRQSAPVSPFEKQAVTLSAA